MPSAGCSRVPILAFHAAANGRGHPFALSFLSVVQGLPEPDRVLVLNALAGEVPSAQEIEQAPIGFYERFGDRPGQWIIRGEIPARKVGRERRCSRSKLHDWLGTEIDAPADRR